MTRTALLSNRFNLRTDVTLESSKIGRFECLKDACLGDSGPCIFAPPSCTMRPMDRHRIELSAAEHEHSHPRTRLAAADSGHQAGDGSTDASSDGAASARERQGAPGQCSVESECETPRRDNKSARCFHACPECGDPDGRANAPGTQLTVQAYCGGFLSSSCASPPLCASTGCASAGRCSA